MSSNLLRDLLEPLLPEGLSYETLYPLTEQLDPLGKLATDKTTDRSIPYPEPRTQDDYKDVLAQQETLRTLYTDRLSELLDRAEESGPRSRAGIMREFDALAEKYLTKAHELGMEATTMNPHFDDVAKGYVEDRVGHEREHFADFLKKIWDGEEVMDRDQRREMYGRTIDSMFNQGGLSGLTDDTVITWVRTAKESCEDCIEIAENGPYSKPGVTDGPYPELPTIPRRGDTECISNCRCYLEFETAGRITGMDRPVEPGYDIEPDEPESLEIEPEEANEIQQQADELGARMQWAKAMYDATGDREYLTIRKEANQDLIDLQEEHGLRMVPRMESDAMSKVVNEGMEIGYEPVVPPDNGKLTGGMDAALVDGVDFYHGELTEWDTDAGTGTFEDTDGQAHPVSSTEDPPTVLMVEGKTEFIDRPWSIPKPETPDGFVSQIQGRQVSYAEEMDPRDCNEGLDEAVSPCNPAEAIEVIRQVVETVPVTHTFGAQFVAAAVSAAFGFGFVVRGRGVLFRGLHESVLSHGQRRSAILQGVGVNVYQQKLFPGLTGEQMEKIRVAVADRPSYALPDVSEDERSFSLLYDWYWTDPEGLEAFDSGIFQWIEEELGEDSEEVDGEDTEEAEDGD